MLQFSIYVILAFCATIVMSAHASPLDSLEGKWLGTQEYAPDKYAPDAPQLGLEFKRTKEGNFSVSLYQTVMSLYNVDLPSGVQYSNGVFTLQDMGISFTLANGVLKGVSKSGTTTFSLRRTNLLPTEPPIPNVPNFPNARWQTKLGSAIYATAAIYDTLAYVGTSGGVFNAVSVKSGDVVWTYSAGRPIHGEALTTNDAVLFVCDNGFLFKLNRTTGKELWRYNLGDAQVSRILPHPFVYDYDVKAPKPVLIDSLLYIGSGDGSIHAVNIANGQRVWRHETQGKVRTEALASGSQIIVGTWENMLYALDRVTGKEVWKKDMKGVINSAPALVDGKLILGTRGAVLYAIKPENGDILWRAPYWGSWVESSAVSRDGLLYIGSSDLRRVVCYNPSNGKNLWRTDVYGWTWNRPVLTEKYVFVGVGGTNPYFTRHIGSLTALDRKTGAIVWRTPAPEPSGYFQTGFVAAPAISGKTLVIGGLDGTLSAFEVE
ncbi:MAG: PQQ-binding-like beta-propeller repeat protein [Candidatus Kapabacteria bacterium]|jgi:outer membrane protein assembly factor BamB|nr:PQQ-binding-like beta-propeller repeat protein [Candidatus Kapabacteria bacterium]